MTLLDKIAQMKFFNTDGRSIDMNEATVQENAYLVHALFKDSVNPNNINSVLLLRGGYRGGKDRTPGYIVITTGSVNLKYDIDESEIIISLASSGDKSKIKFDLTCQEDAFFQESLVTDMGTLTYDFIEVCHELKELVKKHDEALLGE